MSQNLASDLLNKFENMADCRSESFGKVPENLSHQNFFVETGQEEIKDLVSVVRDEVFSEILAEVKLL